MYKKSGIFLLFVLVIGLISFGFYKSKGEDNRLDKTNTNDVYKYIAINQILMYVSNNGDGSHDPRTDGNGFYWPGGENATQSAIFEDGLIFGGKIGREIRVNGNTHRQGLQAGKILNDGTPDDPSLSKYRVFRIRKGFETLPPGPTKDEFQKDYDEWPVEDGAPWVDIDGDGIFTRGVDEPEFVGDEVLWYVANDMDPAKSSFTYGTLPMGLEFQTTIFGFNRTGDLGDMVFKKYTIINKGANTIRDMILGYWSDTDLGDAADDFTGADTSLSLGYTYNGDASDDVYGNPCPAVGYDFFQGPIVPADNPLAVSLGLPDSAKFLGEWRQGFSNLPMTAFAFYINGSAVYQDPPQGTAEGSIQFYRYLQGRVWNDDPFIDPNTLEETVFVLTGDPVAGTGWYEGEGWPGGQAPNDRRHLMSSGPFTMAPGDTQEVVVGIVIGVGPTTLLSVSELKRKDFSAQLAFDLDFKLTPAPPAPKVTTASGNRAVTLYWEPNAESYDEGDPIIYGQGFDDTTYTFEGYRVWQYSNLSGENPTLLAAYDIDNGITEVDGVVNVNGRDVVVPLITGFDEGLRRFYNVTIDIYSNAPLRNLNPYYFGVTAYGVSLNSAPKFLESPPVIVEVFPGRTNVDQTSPYVPGSNLIADHIGGVGDGDVTFKIIDPNALTGDDYQVIINGAADSLSYTLLNVTTQDTLLKNETDFGRDTLHKPIVDGFIVLVENKGQENIDANLAQSTYLVKTILEVAGPGGTQLAEPVPVFDELNSTGNWMIKAKGPLARLNWQAKPTDEALGYVDYELRFTGTSQYYSTGYAFSFVPQTKSDTLSAGTLPYQVYDIGRDVNSAADDERLAVKVLDFDRTDLTRAIPDKVYSQLPNGDWEEIYAYSTELFDPSGPYPELSDRSDILDHKFGALSISGDLPAAGTVIRIVTWKPLTEGDVFQGKLIAQDNNDKVAAKDRLQQITVFPNPYFGANALEVNKQNRFIRFTGLPTETTIRIYSLSGVFVRRIDKNDNSQFVNWDLLNSDALPVASGIYLAYLDMPGIGTKILKLAIIQEQQYIDRI